jgi:cell division protein FtsL
MKKIMSILLGLTLAMGAVSVVFAQDKTDDTTKKKEMKKKKKEDKKEETK